MNVKEELRRQMQHAIYMIVLWVILVGLNISDILEQGIHDAGVRHWIILGLGILVVICEIVNILKIRRQQKEL